MGINSNSSSKFASDFSSEEEFARPQFLKILCILSFIASGLLIIFYALCTLFLTLNEEMIGNFWNEVIKVQPSLENVDPNIFFHEIGMLSMYNIIANVFSLIGIILMWRLNKIGFYIYLVAELVSNFLSLNLNTGEAEKSYSGLVFYIFIDLIFIVLYFMNLKHMKSNNIQTHH